MPAFDAFLQILDTNGAVLAFDDDGGGGFNSKITETRQPGVYRIEVTTAYEGQTGAYTLAIAP